MEAIYQLDNLDRKILRELVKDARVPYVEVAKALVVSAGTIHQRINKMKVAGVLKGFQPVLNRERLGLSITAIVGIYLKTAKDCNSVVERLNKLPEVTEVHYTTGSYALVIKISTGTIEEFRSFLMGKLQAINEIQSTESFMCLDTPIDREARI